jgi:hypothetical protein
VLVLTTCVFPDAGEGLIARASDSGRMYTAPQVMFAPRPHAWAPTVVSAEVEPAEAPLADGDTVDEADLVVDADDVVVVDVPGDCCDEGAEEVPLSSPGAGLAGAEPAAPERGDGDNAGRRWTDGAEGDDVVARPPDDDGGWHGSARDDRRDPPPPPRLDDEDVDVAAVPLEQPIVEVDERPDHPVRSLAEPRSELCGIRPGVGRPDADGSPVPSCEPLVLTVHTVSVSGGLTADVISRFSGEELRVFLAPGPPVDKPCTVDDVWCLPLGHDGRVFWTIVTDENGLGVLVDALLPAELGAGDVVTIQAAARRDLRAVVSQPVESVVTP